LVVGVAALWGLSAIGGFGGTSGRAYLWGMLIVSYPIGRPGGPLCRRPGARRSPWGRMKTIVRCAWAQTPLSVEYHDREWGVPVHDDRTLFEFLTLEGAQAGLSWETILRKRGAHRQAFSDFNPQKVAKYD